MASPIEEIKSRLDLVELIQGYIRLQKAGINYKANCPFHTEKTASFFVSPTRQIWHCFGCGRGGDMFKFIMEIEGQDFPEALRLLAQRTGVVLTREDPSIRSARNRLYDLCEEAAFVFERSLGLTPGVKSYLKKRGMSDECIKEFRVGFAPQSWDFLIRALSQKGFQKEEIEKAGLAVRSEDGSSWYDRFRGRIIFPISDANGRIVGFGGRIFEEAKIKNPSEGETRQKHQESRDEAKYVNTPTTLIYDKSHVLYGFDRAKQEVRIKNQAVLVEGYMDCIMSHQAGVKNTIAVSGTALTPLQLKTLRRICDTLVTSFDADAAGESATKRSLMLASQFGFERRVAVIPSGKDPADAVLENPQEWVNAVSGALSVISFYFEKAFRIHQPTEVQGKKAISAMLFPWIAELTNEVEKAHWVDEFSRRLSIPQTAVWRELEKQPQAREARGSLSEEIFAPRPSGRRELLEERFLTLLVLLRDETRSSALTGHHVAFTSDLNRQLCAVLQGGGEIADARAPELQRHLELITFKSEVIAQMVRDPDEEFLLCRRELEKECVREQLLQLGRDIEEREKKGDTVNVSPLLQSFRELSGKLRELSS